jgi:hypothetical protein
MLVKDNGTLACSGATFTFVVILCPRAARALTNVPGTGVPKKKAWNEEILMHAPHAHATAIAFLFRPWNATRTEAAVLVFFVLL